MWGQNVLGRGGVGACGEGILNCLGNVYSAGGYGDEVACRRRPKSDTKNHDVLFIG